MKEANHTKTNIIGLHVSELPRIVKCTGTENRMVIATGWGHRGMESYYSMHMEFQSEKIHMFCR